MADGKRSFILYADFKHTVDILDDEKAGKLFKHLLAYVNDESPMTDDPMVALAFEPMKHQLKRDLRKREEIKEKRVEAGRLGGLARANNANQSKQMLASASKSKQMLASASKSKQTLANQAVTVNGNVTVNDNVSVTNSDAHTPEVNFSDVQDVQETKKDPEEPTYDKTARIAKQRHAETYSTYLAHEWEKHTGKVTLVTDTLKRRVLNMANTPGADVEKFMTNYAELYNFIDKHDLRKDIYYPIRQYDLDKFLEKINTFTGDTYSILGNITIKESTTKVLAIWRKENNIVSDSSSPPTQPVEQVAPLSVKQKQKAKESLTQYKNKLLEQVTA